MWGQPPSVVRPSIARLRRRQDPADLRPAVSRRRLSPHNLPTRGTLTDTSPYLGVALSVLKETSLPHEKNRYSSLLNPLPHPALFHLVNRAKEIQQAFSR